MTSARRIRSSGFLGCNRVIVGAFVLGMLLTPPDMISQTLLAVPMWLLFEVGIVFSRFVTKPEVEEEAAAESLDVVANETSGDDCDGIEKD